MLISFFILTCGLYEKDLYLCINKNKRKKTTMKVQLKKVERLLEKMEFLKEQIAEELNEIMETRIDQFDERSEKWQEGEKGYEFQEKTDEIGGFADEFDTNISDAISELQSQIENF